MLLVKGMFGGLGNNFANPAITARIVLLLSFGEAMNKFSVKSQFAAPRTMGSADVLTSATPLTLMRAKEVVPSYMKLFLGQHAGTIGEVSAAALLLGCIYLVVRGVIDLWIPATYVGTVAVGARDRHLGGGSHRRRLGAEGEVQLLRRVARLRRFESSWKRGTPTR